MNLRIHKKLAKRAAPMLARLGDRREQYKAEKYECYFGHGYLYPCDWKHWERHRALYPFGTDFKFRPRHDKHWIVLRHPIHPLKGTMMVGSMAGYYEPEWEEETAWESLCRLVEDHFTEWDGESFVKETGYPRFVITRDLGTPSKILRAAREMFYAKEAK